MFLQSRPSATCAGPTDNQSRLFGGGAIAHRNWGTFGQILKTHVGKIWVNFPHFPKSFHIFPKHWESFPKDIMSYKMAFILSKANVNKQAYIWIYLADAIIY